MKVVNLGETNTVLNSFIAEIRDAHIQKDRMRFRINLERVGSIFAYEISKTLSYSEKEITTPLAIAQMKTADTPLVVTAILRAGLPLQEGILGFFDRAESGFLSTWRKHGKGDYFKVHADYCTCPPLEGKTLIVADPMLATGASMESALQKLEETGGDDGRDAEGQDVPALQVLSDRLGDFPAGIEVRGVEQSHQQDIQYDEPDHLLAEQQLGDQHEVVDQVYKADRKKHIERGPEVHGEAVAVAGDQPRCRCRQQHRAGPYQDLRDVEDETVVFTIHLRTLCFYKYSN